jgi:hypothetical protein
MPNMNWDKILVQGRKARKIGENLEMDKTDDRRHHG